MAGQKSYKTLGGWLLVFLIWTIIRLLFTAFGALQNLTSLSNLEEFYFNFGIRNNLLMTILIVLAMFQVVINVLIVSAILKKSIEGNKTIKNFYLITMIVSALVYALSIAAMNGFIADNNMSTLIGNVIGDLFAFFTGYLYFSISKRAKVYFGNETGQEQEPKQELENE